MLWVEKYCPTQLDELCFHDHVTKKLHCMADFKDFPHLLFHGPAGSGKMTRVRTFLRKAFGDDILKSYAEEQLVRTDKSSLQVRVVRSPHHIECNLENLDTCDALVCQHFVKEVATCSVRLSVIVLRSADLLSYDAQAALRRLMEVYVTTCRFILVARSASQIIQPLQSRCLCLRVGAPSLSIMERILEDIFRAENVPAPPPVCASIARASHRDLRRAIMMAETMAVQLWATAHREKKLGVLNTLPHTLWELEVTKLVTGMLDVRNHHPRFVHQVLRAQIEELVARTLRGQLILSSVTREIANSRPLHFNAIYEVAQTYDKLLSANSNPLHVLEAFCVRLMSTLGKLDREQQRIPNRTPLPSGTLIDLSD